MSKIAVGIDIGTYQVKVVVAEKSNQNGNLPKIIGAGYAESKGMRHGYIINQNDAIRSIRKATKQAEQASGTKIDKAYVSVGGIGLGSYISEGSVVISRADSEITELDIEKATAESEKNIPRPVIQNKRIIHTIPIEYKIDGNPILSQDPVGMKGMKLDCKVLYITCLEHHVVELINAVTGAGIEIADVMATPLAASLVTLSKSEKIAGCVLANIGSETVSMVVYEDDIPIALEVFPIGSNNVTHDIALGMKVSLEEAEKIKKDRDRGIVPEEFPKKKLDDIVIARMSDIFEMIDATLKKMNKSGMLPAGVIISGGGSGIINIEDLARATLKLPSKLAKFSRDKNGATQGSNGSIKVKDATWSVAYGLCVFGLHAEGEGSISAGLGKRLIKNTLRKISNWFKRFLP